VASSKREAIAMEKIEDMQKIVSYSVMSTPAVVIDGKVVHAGGIPSRSKVESWF
jgi:predicted thioredoxin/glutaredoxin